jgi:hypothetical protein
MAAATKKEKKRRKAGSSSGHITNLKQSILETFGIYIKTHSFSATFSLEFDL